MRNFRCFASSLSSQLKSVVIHTRDAWDDTLAILGTVWAPTRTSLHHALLHGQFRTGARVPGTWFFLSYGGVTTFPKAAEVREAAQAGGADAD